MLAAIYSRKSKFTGKGESVENQVQLCKEFCLNHNIELYDIYEDEGFSGGNVKRPEYQRMLKDAKSKKFNIILSYRLDRISRNISDFSNLITELNDLNIGFISIREQFDTTTPLGRAMMYISSVFAQLERETTAERIKDNMHQLARTGRWLGGTSPLGFKSNEIKYFDSSNKERKMNILSPIDEELKTVKILFHKYYELKGIHKLEGYCFQNNIKSRNGNFFEKSALNFILTNPVYAKADILLYEYCKNKNMDIAAEDKRFDGIHGLMVYNKRTIQKGRASKLKSPAEWIVSVGEHEGIIDSDLWIQVQNMINTMSSKAPRSGTSKVSLLTPLLVCAHCGTSMRVNYRYVDGQVKHHYYKCRLKERSRGKECNMPNINGTEAETQVINYVKKIALDQKLASTEIKKKLQSIENIEKDAFIEKENVEKAILKKEKAINNLTLQLSQNLSSSAASYIIKQIEAIDMQIKTLRQLLITVNTESDVSSLKELNIQFIQQQLNYFSDPCNLNFEEKKKLLHSIIKKITWDGKSLNITLYDTE